MATAYVLVAVAALGQSTVRDELPQRLREAIDSQVWDTAYIEWTVTNLYERDYGLVERHVTRTVGDTLWETNLGDENGFHRTVFDTSHNPIPKEELRGAQHSMVSEGLLWRVEHRRDSLPNNAFAIDEAGASGYRPVDFRSLGIALSASLGMNALGLTPPEVKGLSSATITQARNGTMDVVTAEYGRHMLEWHIDRTRGGLPTSAMFYVQGKPWRWSETELVEQDGRWFPARISFYEQFSDEPLKVIEIQEASFDEPWHDRDIDPSDLGMLFGTNLWTTGQPGAWDGSRLVPHDEWQELFYIHGVRPDPLIMERRARASGYSLEEYLARIDRSSGLMRARYLKKHGEWDLYVKAFMKKHKLDEARVARAQALLTRAKKLRDHYRRKQGLAEKKAARASGDGPTAAAEKKEKYETLVQRVFDRVLVRGLEKLIPREKRRAG